MTQGNLRSATIPLLLSFLSAMTSCTVPNPTRRTPGDAAEDTMIPMVDGAPPLCSATQSPRCANSDDYDLFVVDVDGDGKSDLIAKEKKLPGNWNVAINTGMGFQPQPSPWMTDWAMASHDFDYFAVDVNGDHKTDLIAKDKQPPGAWHVALSTGSAFQPQPSPWLTDWATVSDTFDFFAVDVNGDGKSDLIAKDKNPPSRWQVAINSGSAFLPQPSAWLTGWADSSEPYNLFAVDVNGDKKADLIAKEKNSPGYWYVALNTGSSFVAQPPWLSDWAVNSQPYNLLAVDVNNDGKSDLIAKEKNTPGNWYVALNTGSAFVAQPPWLSGWATPSNDSDLFVADVNGDGLVDLLSKEKKDPSDWHVAKNNGSAFNAQTQPF